MKALKALALATVPLVGAFLCVLLFQAERAVQRASDDTHSVLTAAVVSTAKLNAAADTVSSSVAGVSRTVNASVAGVPQTIAEATATLRSADAVLQTVNRPCEQGKPCGTLADAARTLATVRGTFGEVEKAAVHENRNLVTLDAQEAQLFQDAHDTLTSAHTLIASPDVADSMKQADAILADARFEADKFAHPPKKKLGFWGATAAAGDWLRHFMPPIF
jgi:hypothetical protein